MNDHTNTEHQPIALNPSSIANRLHAIADELIVESTRVSHAIDQLLQDGGTARLVRAVRGLNDAMDPFIGEIARLTGNAEPTLRQTYAPTDPGVQWFRAPSATEFLRCVAQYESFNLRSWREKGWQGWGKHPELADPVSRVVQEAEANRSTDKVEVFHWAVCEELRGLPLKGPIEQALFGVMRGKDDVISDILADSNYWAKQGLSFRKVAEVDGQDFGVAFDSTNHIHRPWVQNQNIDRSWSTAPGCDERSTSVGDIMRCGNRLEIVAPLGFTPLPVVCNIWLDRNCEVTTPKARPRP